MNRLFQTFCGHCGPQELLFHFFNCLQFFKPFQHVHVVKMSLYTSNDQIEHSITVRMHIEASRTNLVFVNKIDLSIRRFALNRIAERAKLSMMPIFTFKYHAGS